MVEVARNVYGTYRLVYIQSTLQCLNTAFGAFIKYCKSLCEDTV